MPDSDTTRNQVYNIWFFSEVNVILRKTLAIMLTGIKEARKLAGFRLPLSLIEKVKIAAKTAGTSVNDYVCATLALATKDIETQEEMENHKRETQAFLDRFGGAWIGSESDEDLKSVIQSNKSISSPVEL